MLDVHPPHAPTHTWRDFFIHIATITVGLLIAVGLEQTVEALHRNHLRHTLEAELHQETLENKRIAEGDLRWMNVRLDWLLDLKAKVDEVRESHGKVKAQPPPNPPLPPNALGDIDLVLTAWDTARQSAQIDLLPHEEALLYSKVYSMAGQVLHQDVLTVQQIDVVAGFLISRHSDAAHFELSQLSDHQLEELSHAVAMLFTNLQEQKQDMLLTVAAVECVLKHRTSVEERIAESKAAAALYANPRSDAQSPTFWGN